MPLPHWVVTSLRTKLMIMFVLLTAIPLIIVGMVMYVKTYHTISYNSISSTLNVTEQLKREMDVLFIDTGKLFQVGKNSSVLRFLLDPSETYPEAKDILNSFSLYRESYNLSNGITNIILLNLYGKGISEKRGVFQTEQDLMSVPYLSRLMNNSNDTYVIPPSEIVPLDNFDHATYTTTDISLVSAIKQPITDELIGFMIIRLDAKMVESLYMDKGLGQTGFFFITDSNGNPLFSPRSKVSSVMTLKGYSKINEQSGSFVRNDKGKETFVVYSTSEYTGWKIVGEAPLREILKDANEIQTLIILSVACTIIFTIVLYFYVTSRLIRPIRYLRNKMHQAAYGFFEAKVSGMGQDEIADLGKSFNMMLDQIHGLLEQSLKEQEEIKKSELKILQAQINPHFLYNTLDTIVWMAESKKSDEVIKLVGALTKFFRISLSKGKDWITVKEEFEHVKNYLVIQQIRYRDLLDFRIDLDERIENSPILKVTLQPLVENAIYHGIKNKRGKGLVAVTGEFVTESLMRLIVSDNGAGMTPSQAELVRESLKNNEPMEHSKSGGFGLYNVNQRLRLFYGIGYEISIESEAGNGTQIILQIPVWLEDEYEKSFFGGR